jgi:pyridoxamine 5'-phosphate oxidase-like protein
MATWSDVVRDAPEFAHAVQERFDAKRHKTLATLRRDGAPRISGIEATFSEGELWLGMMHGSRKASDLQRDPRLALHSATWDPEMADGDAKIAGRGIEVTDQATIDAFVGTTGEKPPGPFHLFRVDVKETVLIRIGDPPDHLVIETWRENEGLRRIDRR